MPFSDGGIVVEELDERFWQVAEPLEYHGATERFVVPAGFRTDFASVPRPVVWLIPRYGAYTKAAILHDYLLSSGVVSAADADGIFRRTLGELGVSVPRRWMMWAAVRFASRLRGATAGDIARFLLVAVLSVLFLAVPVTVVTVYLILFWFIELIAWAIHRSTHRPPEPAPTPDMKSA
ncbi:DUF1353 domain-containing protein [Nocardia cyriacigeorgica]|uniref:DUF1353 domain-containing protein n=1 Tax=Nocardia cyriacigeorgica TaxID=135487 RepID=UPI0013D39614|nr:DUF1353 domain-containing protein [Nocardia cyriacigeorgica]MBF6439090.1 DUF1353 domain-containing protein [Nocardia cyriacigeorgica]MBF6455345.1 DUF1353 domain-containing protein [Nocardia cyriacigeorgica]MBF6478954.1 DUF1353 domain-containing protein [Nocardia cyriacigeorgica]MBF6553913.1 DUF1353 domain-containing protein [Nocardia cyriacigeorgica]NEW29803.1 DUF1353 domain-containing protein [Nocardia cyriacigeorgica]